MSSVPIQAPGGPGTAGFPTYPARPIAVACERQSLARGEARLDRIRGVGTLIYEDPATCRLLFQISERSGLVTPADRVALSAGRWAASVGGSISAQVQRGGEIVALSFPLSHLSRNVVSQMQWGTGALRPTSGAALMCLELARACVAQTEPLNPSVDDALGEAMIELGKLALIEQFCTARSETVRETARARIQAFIHRNIADPELTIARIAERMRCTKRYLHKIFSEEDETLNQYIWSQRLELCRARLSQADLADRSITEIAFACGFSNAAHFSRSFRARFGQAPRAYRRTALARYFAERSRMP
jgi:AraC-like DNA-binding protein